MRSHFSDKEAVKVQDIKAFYRSIDPDVSETAVNGRIRSLVQQEVLHRTGHGVYSMADKNVFRPTVDETLENLYQTLRDSFPYTDLCIWSTSIFSEFMTHQLFRFYTVADVDAESVPGVFYAMQEKGYSVFRADDARIIERYGNQQDQLFIVKPIITQAPVIKINGIVTCRLEKALVDLFCDTELFNAHQGNERNTIFKEAFKTYTINQNKLLRYAGRRGQKKRLSEYLEKLGLMTIPANK